MTDAELTVAVLRDARTRITDPDNWTRRANARDYLGAAVAAEDPEASCWCLHGALLWAMARHDEVQGGIFALLGGVENIVSLSDQCGHAAALRALDRTIERVELRRDA